MVWYFYVKDNNVIDFREFSGVLLVFSVTPFKIDQNKNQNRSTDKVQNLGDERRYIYKDRRQDSGQRNISYTSYPKKCFTQTYTSAAILFLRSWHVYFPLEFEFRGKSCVE